ncbi:MAG TPA: xanthine dehydrogenase family protein molybdopterin-binding subunit, partial [Solirubrobacteraceae bacterium]|nr:xanthine dehydrogenase family protein molybdopterin-binding subunit [Solirubrobacteraceae bacterium]
MSSALQLGAIGTSLQRIDGVLKVTGTAAYAFEQPVERPTYMHALLSQVARGTIVTVDSAEASAMDGVVLVLTYENAPRLADENNQELFILQDPEVHFRGQIVGAVVAESPEIAREAAARVRITYVERPHDVVLRADHPELYKPDQVNPSFETDTAEGDMAEAIGAASITIDQHYTTPMEHNNPMEPHATIAIHVGDALTLYDSTQGPFAVASSIAPLFGLEPQRVRVIAPHVGGGFGSKGTPHAHIVLAGLAAQMIPGRAVKLALTRQQMFSLVGYRTPTIQHVRIAADADGRLLGISNEVVEQTARIKEFAEQTAVPTRMMYAAASRLTAHRLAPLDVPVPSWMRAPGECPGMFAPEVAMDELAHAAGVDPVDLRILNEPETDPETGNPWSSRRLTECLRDGAERFGWSERHAQPASRHDDGWLVGLGVASAVYPVNRMPGTSARIIRLPDGRYCVHIAAADIGTGAWTSLTQIAADALGVSTEQIDLQIGDSSLPPASVAGGSSGTTTWGSGIVAAAERFREVHGDDPPGGAAVTADTPENPDEDDYAMYAFGAHFAEARVNAATGEIRVPRMLGIFDAGRIINPRLARSQFIGG